MASENDFYVLGGNSYRGSRYANFSGAGVDTQGNVSTDTSENAANNLAQTPSAQPTPQITPDMIDSSDKGVALTQDAMARSAAATPAMSPGATKSIIGAAAPSAASTIGGQIGANIAAGAPAFSNMGSAITNRVSAGLLGSSASSQAVNAAQAAMGSGVYGPPTPSSVSSAGAGGGIGAAVGSGVGTAAMTLLMGGSVKDAAFQGAGAAGGAYLGSMILPGIGTAIGSFIGSTIGSFVSKIFGGGTPRVTASASFTADDSGRYVYKTGGKNTDQKTRNAYAGSIQEVLNKFGEVLGIEYTGNFGTHTNIGKKDKKTTLLTPSSIEKQRAAYDQQVAQQKAMYDYYSRRGDARGPFTQAPFRPKEITISQKPGDIDSVVLGVLRDRDMYKMNGSEDFNNFWTNSLQSSKSLSDLAGAVDGYYASQSLLAPPPNAQNSIARRAGDRYATFYG